MKSLKPNEILKSGDLLLLNVCSTVVSGRNARRTSCGCHKSGAVVQLPPVNGHLVQHLPMIVASFLSLMLSSLHSSISFIQQVFLVQLAHQLNRENIKQVGQQH